LGCFIDRLLAILTAGKSFDHSLAERNVADTHATQLWMAGAIIYSGAMLFVKLSFLFLYRRIFTNSVSFFVQWWCVVVLVVGYSVAGMLSSLMSCLPIAMAWDLTITNGVCINKAAFYIANACLNVVTDVAILALPILPISRTCFNRRQRIMLYVLFGSGSL
jgi:hypothetical protein